MKPRMIFSAVCLLLCGLLLFACATDEENAEGDASFQFYYPRNECDSEGAFCAVSAGIDAEELSLQELVTAYLQAPVPENCCPAVPEDWRLAKAEMDGSSALVRFTGTSVSGVERSVTLACLTQTLLQLEEADSIYAFLPGEADPVILAESDIQTKDLGMLPQEELMVYYTPDAQMRYLTAQTLSVEAMTEAEKPAFLMDFLLEELTGSCIPEGTTLLDISVENGVCTLNLSSEFVKNLPQSFSVERMAVYAIVNSLTELDSITTVDFWVTGAPLDTLYLMDLSAGVGRDESVVAASVNKDAVDITLYPAHSTDGLLVPIARMLEPKSDGTMEEAALEALLRYEGGNGLQSCIPSGTKLLSLRLEDGTCTVDLTGEFLGGCADAQQEACAVRSVVATMCALPEIQSVEILVEGLEPSYRDSSLALVHQVEEDWLAE